MTQQTHETPTAETLIVGLRTTLGSTPYTADGAAWDLVGIIPTMISDGPAGIACWGSGDELRHEIVLADGTTPEDPEAALTEAITLTMGLEALAECVDAGELDGLAGMLAALRRYYEGLPDAIERIERVRAATADLSEVMASDEIPSPALLDGLANLITTMQGLWQIIEQHAEVAAESLRVEDAKQMWEILSHGRKTLVRMEPQEAMQVGQAAGAEHAKRAVATQAVVDRS